MNALVFRLIVATSLVLGSVCAGCDSSKEEGESDSGGLREGHQDTDPEVPTGDYCSPVSDWSEDWAKLEAQVLVLVNEARAKGQNCGHYGQMPPVPALKANAHLRCSARVHSKDMAENSYFDHTSQDGTRFSTRILNAGYEGGRMGENIAAGSPTAERTMQQWLESDGHCSNLMSEDYTHLGVGYYRNPSDRYEHFWTQNFGAPERRAAPGL